MRFFNSVKSGKGLIDEAKMSENVKNELGLTYPLLKRVKRIIQRIKR